MFYTNQRNAITARYRSCFSVRGCLHRISSRLQLRVRRLQSQLLQISPRSVQRKEPGPPTSARCPPTTGRALKPSTSPFVVSYQSPSGCELSPSAAYLCTALMKRSRTAVVVEIAAVQMDQSGMDTMISRRMVRMVRASYQTWCMCAEYRAGCRSCLCAGSVGVLFYLSDIDILACVLYHAVSVDLCQYLGLSREGFRTHASGTLTAGTGSARVACHRKGCRIGPSCMFCKEQVYSSERGDIPRVVAILS